MRRVVSCRARLAVAVVVLGTSAFGGGAAQAAGPQPLQAALSGTNGVGRIVTPGRPCAEGGSGSYRHYAIDSPVAGGVLSSLAGRLRASLDVHRDGDEPPVAPVTKKAFLQGTESHATFTNQRGAVQLRLSSGSCAAPTLTMDNALTTTGFGTWTLDPGATNGAYREATGSGTFALLAGLAPGADNLWQLKIDGSISVLQPSLALSVVRTFWSNLGLDYVSRKVSVTYKVTNTGPGDAFGVKLTGSTSPTAGVTPIGPVPQSLGDLLAGESAEVTVRYQFGLTQPCSLVILGCEFDSTMTFLMPDALDVPASFSKTVHAKAPNLPPPA